MTPSFNTAGPCIPGEHYMLPPERRLARVLRQIEDRRYFTLHAGRQTGKTTSLMWLERHLNATGRWRALWVDLEMAREQPDPAKAVRSILTTFDRALARRHPALNRPDAALIATLLTDPPTAVHGYLGRLSELDPRPLVLLLGEADGLVGEAMVSFLTQLRDGYIARSQAHFPASVALVGQRQVRDYVFSAEERSAVSWLGTTSPFNISTEAMTLASFTEVEVGELLDQHTAATGQRFEPEAVRRIWELGQGHPWLTNAIADQIVNEDVEDRGVAVTAAHVEAAKETIILARRSHIDSLVARLREPRVRRILDPMLAGDSPAGDLLDDDLAYVIGLGLAVLRRGSLEIANPIYREVIPRALTFARQVTLAVEPAAFVRPDGRLDVRKLFTDWQVFWRKDGHLAAAGFGYREAGPHLMLMSFLQRVVNGLEGPVDPPTGGRGAGAPVPAGDAHPGGGRVEREYGLGRGALDLMIFWKADRHVIEVKVRRDTETEVEALDLVARYLDLCGLAEGWLVMFDLRKEPAWTEKLYLREVDHKGKKVWIVGC